MFSLCLLADGGDVGYFRENGVRCTLGRSCGESKPDQDMDRENVAEYGSCAYSESW